MVRVQASIAEERKDTSPWSLVAGARPTVPPRDASTHTWTLPSRTIQLHVDGDTWPGVGEHAGHSVCFDGELYNAAEHEMIVKLDDFMRRRSKIDLVVHDDDIRQSPGLEEVAEILFGSDADRRLDEYFSEKATIG